MDCIVLGVAKRQTQLSDFQSITYWVCHNFSSKDQVSSNFIAAVIWGPRKIKSVTDSIVSSSIFHKVMGPDATIFVYLMSFKPAC